LATDSEFREKFNEHNVREAEKLLEDSKIKKLYTEEQIKELVIK
jgi:hypothetical protein